MPIARRKDGSGGACTHHSVHSPGFWLHPPSRAAFRWAVYQRTTRIFCLYVARDEVKGAAKRSAADYEQMIDAKSRGSCVVQHAVRKAAPKRPFGIDLYSSDVLPMVLSADGPSELDKWLDAMPNESASGPKRRGAITRRASSALEGALLDAMRAEVRKAGEASASGAQTAGIGWIRVDAEDTPPPPDTPPPKVISQIGFIGYRG